MNSMSGKKTKKLFGKLKFLGGDKKKAEPSTPPKPKPPNSVPVPDSDYGVTQSEVFAVEESEQFDADLVRMSLLNGDEIDHFSFDGDAESKQSSDDDDMFMDGENDDDPKEMWAKRYTPRTPREVAVGNIDTSGNNSSDDEDDMYLDDDEEETKKQDDAQSQAAEEDSDEEGDDTLMDLPSAGSKSPSIEPRSRTNGGGVTQSIIDFTSGDASMRASVGQIDQLMEVSDEKPQQSADGEDPEGHHEDGSALLAQMNTALSIREFDQEDRVGEIDELETELEEAELETDNLAQRLDESEANNKSLEEKLQADDKSKIEEIAERGEQVHMARHFALQSVKLVDFKLDESKQVIVPEQMEAFEESEDSEENEAETNHVAAVAIIEGKEEGEETALATNSTGRVEVRESEQLNDEIHSIEAIETQEGSTLASAIKTIDADSEGETGLGIVISTAYSSDGEDSEDYVEGADEDFMITPTNTVLAEKARMAEIDSMSKKYDTMTVEDGVKVEKLRSSMNWARSMSQRGDAIRDDPSYLVGETEDDHDFAEGEKQFTNDREDMKQSLQLTDMQMAEVTELRARLQEQQDQIEGLEHERDYNASKVVELMGVMKMSSMDDDMRELGEHLAHKSVEVAELNYEVSQLKQKLAQSENRSNTLEAERDANKTVIANLSESLWNDSSLKKATTDQDAAHALIKQGGVIPQNDAMQMTIANLQKKIESLEEEKADFATTISTLTASVKELTQENEARMLKISALESQFLSLNHRQTGAVEMPENSPGSPDSEQKQEKLLRFKAWANNKINQAQEQYETIKDDMDNRRSNANPDQILSS